MIVFADSQTAQQVFEGLLARGVIVRPLSATGLPNCLRISVGTPEENELLIEALDRVRQEMETPSYATVD
jgi:histidinol-phosphate aminotransferase